MNRSLRILVLPCLALALAACGGDDEPNTPIDGGPGDGMIRVDTGPRPDTGPPVDMGRRDMGPVDDDMGPMDDDMGPPVVDMGPPIVDMGPMDDDMGPPVVDMGPPALDTGPPLVDMGPPVVDMGPPVVDMGPMDMGPMDMGPMDMGPPDLGPPDLGPPDMGPMDMGPPPCGNGTVVAPEACDDMNVTPGDGCSATCTVESGFVCTGTMPSVCRRVPLPGQLVITEIMKNPTAVSDMNGEWFEVHNPTLFTFDLGGLIVADDGGAMFTITTALVVAPGGYVVFGNDSATGANGGVVINYEYSGFQLGNGNDQIEIRNGTSIIDRVAYNTAAFPNIDGAALSLGLADNDATSNDMGPSWCAATHAYGAGDLGTPGLANPTCAVLSSASLRGTIPDNDTTGITDTVSLALGTCSIESVDVDIDLAHTFIGDLIVELTSPAGTTVRLHNRTGGAANDIIGNFPGTLTVDGPGMLSTYVGQAASGTWRLAVSDRDPGDLGVLRSWGVNVTCAKAVTASPALVIPDNDTTGVSNIINVTESCTIASLLVDANLVHTFAGDLEVEVTHVETATTVRLLNRPGAPPAPGNPDDLSGTYTFAATGTAFPQITALATIPPGTYQQEGPGSLVDFAGDSTLGMWRINVRDVGSGDTGTLPSWGIRFTCANGAAATAGLPLTIPDNTPAGITDTRNIAGTCSMIGLSVDLAITHTFQGDLIVELRSPTGVTVRLHDRTGGTTDNLVGNYPYSLVPSGGFSSLLGLSGIGTWSLIVSDNATGDIGTLDSWQVNLYCM